nr:gliding motility-associated ABC transporter substrate-binding protein GldG [Mucilaginibacter aquariorum]
MFVLNRQAGKKFINTVFLSTLGIMLFLSLLSGKLFTRFDFTKEKRFTIAPISRKVMDDLPQTVNVTVYLQGDNFPGGMKRLQTSVKDMLADLQAYSHSRLQFEFTDPLKGLSNDQQKQAYEDLASKGIEAQNLSVKTDDGVSQKIIFPFALVAFGDKSIPVKLLQSQSNMNLSPDEILNNSIQNLEYAFTSAIKKITSGGKQRIGFTEGHNELSDLQLNDAMRALSDGYLVGRINLNSIPFDSLAKVSMLVIAKPDKAFNEPEKFKLDQYIMRGGRVLWAIDQVSAELDSLRGHGGEQLAFNKQLNLDDQLFRYGVRINYDLIADMNCSPIPVTTGNAGGQAQIQMLPWLYNPVYLPLSKHPIVKNLDGITSQFASTIDLLNTKNIAKTILLTSSPYNKKLSTPHMLSLQALEDEPKPKDFQSAPKITGVLLEGNFVSDFRNRPLPEGLNEKVTIIPQSKPTKMIVISDGDILRNQVGADGSPYPLGYDHYTQQSYGNKNLLLNIADYMADDSGLISLRSKEIQIRLLNRARIREEKLFWQLLNNIAPIGIVLIFAIFQHYIRRRKYAH